MSARVLGLPDHAAKRGRSVEAMHLTVIVADPALRQDLARYRSQAMSLWLVSRQEA